MKYPLPFSPARTRVYVNEVYNTMIKVPSPPPAPLLTACLSNLATYARHLAIYDLATELMMLLGVVVDRIHLKNQSGGMCLIITLFSLSL